MPNEQANVGKLFEVRLPVTVAIVFGAIVIALTVGFYFITESYKETLVFLAAAAATSGTLLAAFYNGRTLAHLISLQEEQRTNSAATEGKERKARGLLFGTRWNDPTMFHARDTFREILDRRNELVGGNLIDFVEERKTNVIHILNFFEEIGFSVENDLVDYDIVKDDLVNH
jgi:hypothetical protein